MSDPREALGALVREVWAEWAKEQDDPKPSWLVPWEELDEGQREADMRIGATVSAVAVAAERERQHFPRDGVYVRPAAYDVSVWPEAEECIDSETWKVTVEYRGHGLWAVCRAVRRCLNAAGEWDYEMRPSERDDEWLAAHRFPLDAALDLAREHAPHVKINGMTATEVLARHQERHPEGCDG